MATPLVEMKAAEVSHESAQSASLKVEERRGTSRVSETESSFETSSSSMSRDDGGSANE